MERESFARKKETLKEMADNASRFLLTTTHQHHLPLSGVNVNDVCHVGTAHWARRAPRRTRGLPALELLRILGADALVAARNHGKGRLVLHADDALRAPRTSPTAATASAIQCAAVHGADFVDTLPNAVKPLSDLIKPDRIWRQNAGCCNLEELQQSLPWDRF